MHKQHASPGETEKHNEVILVDDQTGETETEEVVLTGCYSIIAHI